MASKTTRPRTSSTSSRKGGKPPSEKDQFKRFAAELKVEDGSPLQMYPEQFELLAPFFDGATETVILLPKKNGKSTLIAAVALYHLLTTPFASCIVVAASRQQAEIILGQVRMFIRQSPALKSRMKMLNREVVSLIDGGKIEVRASDVDTVDGLIPTLAIVDELHRHKNGEVRGVLRLGLGPRKGKMLTISTAGANVDSPLGVLRTRAYEMDGFKRDKRRRRSFVRSGSWAFIEWSLNPDDDPEDIETVKLVNPAPWRTVDVLTQEKTAVTRGEWLRLICNIWTEGEDPWLDGTVWDALADKKMTIEPDESVVVVLDMGAQSRSAAIAVLTTGEQIRCKVELLSSEDKLNLEDIEERTRKLCERYDVLWVVYDSLRFERTAEVLESEGIPVLNVPQRPERMTLASATLHKAIQEKRLVHDGDPALRAQVMAGRVKETERGWRITKDIHSPRPIDALVALAVGCHVIAEEAPVEPMFGWA